MARFTFEEGGAIESLEDFLAEIGKFGGCGPAQAYFRGQGGPVEQLMPSIGRGQHYAGRSVKFTEKEERSLLKRFRRYAYEYFKRVPTEWETLFLARHHGLPTCLLDWTSNPLVALYFAASHKNDEFARAAREAGERRLAVDGTVWAIARLKRWTVPSANKAGIILDLERLAINSRTLFPDLDGLARGLWQTEALRQAKGDGRSD